MTITRIWETGAELGHLLSEFDGYVGTGGSFSEVVALNPKTGTYSLRIGGNYSTMHTAAYKDFASTYQLRLGLHLRHPNPINNDVRILTFQTEAGAANLFRVQCIAAGTHYKFYVKDGAQQVGGLVAVTKDVHHHWGIDLKFDGSSGWCYIYKDGVLVASFNGDTGSSQTGRVLLGTAPTLGTYCWTIYEYALYDDITLDDSTGEGAPAVVPDRRYPLINPDGNGGYSQMIGSDGDQTDNYLLVDEIPPDEADFVRANAASQKDSYTLEDYTKPANASIIAVIPVAVAQKESAADIKLALGTRLSSTNLIGSAQTLPTTYGISKVERQTTKPGGGAWTETDIDNAEVLIESGGTYT